MESIAFPSGRIHPTMRTIRMRTARSSTPCPSMFARFQKGPCGILCRWVSPRVSASAPQEQIHPQYTPFPKK